MKFLLLLLIIGYMDCAEIIQGDKLNAILMTLKEQKGGSRGYPDWGCSIMDNEPAKTIYKAAYGNMDGVVKGLTKLVADKTPTIDCWHEGRGGARKLYSVGDIACFILAQIHDENTIEIVVTEMQRRRSSNEDYAGPVWAIRYYDSSFHSKVMNSK